MTLKRAFREPLMVSANLHIIRLHCWLPSSLTRKPYGSGRHQSQNGRTSAVQVSRLFCIEIARAARLLRRASADLLFLEPGLGSIPTPAARSLISGAAAGFIAR